MSLLCFEVQIVFPKFSALHHCTTAVMLVEQFLLPNANDNP